MDSIEALADEIGKLAAHLDAATQRMLACIRAFDEAGGWHQLGANSCAHWLAWRVGLDTATAREKVRVARALGGLTKIDAALGRGELSYAKVRALTRVATPKNEERLLEFARYATGAQLERICRGVRQVARNLADEGPMEEDRAVWTRDLPGGMVKIEITLRPDEAALMMKAIDKARDGLRGSRGLKTNDGAPTPDPSAESPQPSRADGVVAMAEQLLAGDTRGDGNGDVPSGGADRYQVFVHLDQDALAPDGQLAATLDDGGRVSAESLRRIACDAGLVPTVTGAAGVVGASLDLGRRTRVISPALRRALWMRDRGCRFPGCPHTRFLHGHHLQHWLHGGATRLDNLVLLCSRHHHLVHEGGFQLEIQNGRIIVHPPNARPMAAVPPPDLVENATLALSTWAEERGLEIGPSTNFPWWDGAVPDYDLAVSALVDVS